LTRAEESNRCYPMIRGGKWEGNSAGEQLSVDRIIFLVS